MRWIVYIISLMLAIFGCSKIVIMDIRDIAEDKDSLPTKADTTNVEDTARTPITFSVMVDGWNELEWNE